MDQVRIRNLSVPCIVGVYPHERHSPQPLLVDVSLSLDTEPAGRDQRLHLSIDYAQLAHQLTFLLQSCRFLLLETAAHALARYVLAPPTAGERRAAVKRARITLTKPAALPGGAEASLEIEREAEWGRDFAVEQKPWGTVDVIHETREAGIYRLNVAPRSGIPMHVHRVMREAELVLSPGLLCQAHVAAVGSVRRWPHDAAHDYDNPSDRVASILCVDSPPFIPGDEIEVEREADYVRPEFEHGVGG